MEQLLYILPRGVAIGALISAPMGPIGMLIIQRTLSKGRWPARFTGIGAALSDLIDCLLAGFGLSFVTDFIEKQQLWLQLGGGVLLAIFAAYLFRKNPTRSLKSVETSPPTNYWTDFVTGFLFTFSNPLILFFIVGLFARFCIILPDFGVHHYIFVYVCILSGALMFILDGYDMLGQVRNLSYTVNAQGRTETWVNNIPSYVMLSLRWNFAKKPRE